jgi:putative flippase GtrA
MMAQLARFGGVGVVATLVHVAVALLVSALLAAAPLAANLAGFSASVLFSYFGHARLTFGVALAHRRHGPRFVVTALTGLAASTAITFLCQTWFRLPFWATMALVAVLVPLLNYLMLRLWVFGHARD